MMNLMILMMMGLLLLINGQEIWPGAGSTGSACDSGSVWDGSQCAAAIDGLVCTADAVTSLATMNMPALSEGPVGVAGSLALQINHGLTDGRQVQQVVLNAAYSDCNYPSSSHWIKGLRNQADGADPGCSDLYNATIPWSKATGADGGLGCGLVRSETATEVLFDGTADIYFREELAAQRGQLVSRDVASRVYFRLRFPKTVSASTQLVQFADPRLLAAVTEQLWNPEQLAADATLQLQLQAPFKVGSWQLAAPPPTGIAVALEPLPATDCADESGQQTCTQVWALQLQPQNQTCQLTGRYEFDVVLQCQDNVLPENCPIDPLNNPPVRVTADLQSEDLCAVAETSVGATARLSVHRTFDQLNFQFGDPQSAFFQDQVMHFQLLVGALDGFELQQSQIEQVTVDSTSGNQTTVYSLAAGSDAAWLYQTQFDGDGSTGDQHRHQFQFTADPTVYGQVAEDQSYQSTVTVVCALSFAGDTGGLRKRVFRFPLSGSNQVNNNNNNKRQLTNAEQQGAPEFLETSAKFLMQPTSVEEDVEQPLPVDPDTDNENSEPTAWIPVAAAVGGLLGTGCCMFFVIAAVRRRRRKEEEMKRSPQQPLQSSFRSISDVALDV